MTPTRSLEQLLRRVVRQLQRDSGARFAIAGGLAASLYRREVRATQDVDILFGSHSAVQSRAEALIRGQGLKVTLVRQAELEGGPKFAVRRQSTPVVMVAGRADSDQEFVGLDILLPRLCWIPEALDRAQHHRVDYGLGPCPTMTAEDVVLAKLTALRNRADRFKDLDDLQSIFSHDLNLDLGYLSGRMRQHALLLPKPLWDSAPAVLVKLSKAIDREVRKRARSDLPDLGDV